VPRLAGQHAVYTIRQLKDMQTGARKDRNVALMKPIVDKMSDREMVAVAAYLASRSP
jgi:cytochrome c553